jgi:uncharacterized RDD family membrane protein YckC
VSDFRQTPAAQAQWPVRLPYAALAGVRTRRLTAFLFDFIAISILGAIFFVFVGFLGILTFGLAWLAIPAIYPLVALFYNGLSISGPKMGTPGMRAMDLEMRHMDGGRVSFLTAAVHAVIFYLSWYTVVLGMINLIVSLVSNDKRCVHDMMAGVVVTRRA